jgi:hypothetical protein
MANVKKVGEVGLLRPTDDIGKGGQIAEQS